MSIEIMLHNVHNEGKGEGDNMHQCQRLMRLLKGFRGSSYWSPLFMVQSPVVRLGWWIVCHIIGSWELFDNFTDTDSYLYVELGMGTKNAI
jgi:hypothetical protein